MLTMFNHNVCWKISTREKCMASFRYDNFCGKLAISCYPTIRRAMWRDPDTRWTPLTLSTIMITMINIITTKTMKIIITITIT